MTHLLPWQEAQLQREAAAVVARLHRSSTACRRVQAAGRELAAWLRPSVKLSWERGMISHSALRTPHLNYG